MSRTVLLQLIQVATPTPATIPKTKCSCQVIGITLIPVMGSQPQLAQQTPDVAKQQTGQEQEGQLIILAVTLINITAIIGLVLLSATTPTTCGVSAAVATSSTPPATTATTASNTRTAVCVPAFQSRLRSSLRNNKKINHRLSYKLEEVVKQSRTIES